MFRVLEAQAPPKQNASDTIATLCSRLSSATLLEDRRAAILGLRSFAREYPASVSSGGLTGLIGSLSRDGDDVDTVKLVLETILNLFDPLDGSAEASDDISIWVADQFTQRQENFDVLVSLLGSPAFFSRLYSVQMIGAIGRVRLAKTQQCLLAAPLGPTRLVAALRDENADVRAASTQLLSDLSATSSELQKLAAYEGAFDIVFDNIAVDGGLWRSVHVAQDSISLLANLVRHNPSNQKLFRTSDWIPRLRKALTEPCPVESSDEGDRLPPISALQRDRNVWGLLAVIRLFVPAGGISTIENQTAFLRDGILADVLDLAFAPESSLRVRAEAFNSCADIIRANRPLQEGFAMFEVIPFHSASSLSTPTLGLGEKQSQPEREPTALIEALLNLVLDVGLLELLDVRMAAANCIIAYLAEHDQIQHHFLQRAIEGHLSGHDRVSNVISSLVATGPGGGPDQFRVWMASLIMFTIVQGSPTAKTTLRMVSEGGVAEDEEEIRLIEAVSGVLMSILQRDSIVGLERDAIAYLMLLSAWLFEHPASVDDFLEEGGIVNVLTVFISRPVMSVPTPAETVIVRGLCAALVGIVYDFSRRDSPVPRPDVQAMIDSRIGRETYRQVLHQLRYEPHLRDFDVLPQGLAATEYAGMVPPMFFYPPFVDFFKDRFGRIVKAVDRDPAVEFAASSDGGVDRDVLDGLRGELADKTSRLEIANGKLVDLQHRLEVEIEGRRRETDELARQRNDQQSALVQSTEEQIERIRQATTVQIEKLELGLDEANNRVRAAEQQTIVFQTQAGKAEKLARQAMTTREEVGRQLSVCEEEKRQVMTESIRRERETRDARDALARSQEELRTVGSERDGLVTEMKVKDGKVSSLMAELTTVKRNLDSVRRQAEQEKSRFSSELAAARAQVATARAETEESLGEAERMREAEATAVKAKEDVEKKVVRIRREKELVEAKLVTTSREKESVEKKVKELEVEMKKMKIGTQSDQAGSKKMIDDLRVRVDEAEEGRRSVQTELDDMLMLLGDMEEKKDKYKSRLAGLGEPVSEDEEDDGSGDDK